MTVAAQYMGQRECYTRGVLWSYALVAATFALQPAAATEEQWYGGPAVGSDVASAVLVGVGAKMHQNGEPSAGLAVAYLGVAGLLLGAPVNHFAQGHRRRAIESVGLRVVGGAAAVALGVFGLALSMKGDNAAGAVPFLLGIGTAAAIPIVDDICLARAATTSAPSSSVTLSPSLLLGAGPSLFGVRGTF
jgi:hypothetical protein